MKKTFELVKDGKSNDIEVKRFNTFLDEIKERRIVTVKSSKTGIILKVGWKVITPIIISTISSLIAGFIIACIFGC